MSIFDARGHCIALNDDTHCAGIKTANIVESDRGKRRDWRENKMKGTVPTFGK